MEILQLTKKNQIEIHSLNAKDIKIQINIYRL